MKRLITILIFFISYSAHAQKYPDYGLDKVRIAEPDRIIVAEISLVSVVHGIKSDRCYYWYSSNSIHFSQGGYSGKLLNGIYTEYYLNKNLKEQGIFKKGLKDGTWKIWNEDGTIGEVRSWKNGLIVQKDSVSIWRKLNIFKWKFKKTKVDTTKKVSK